MRNKIFFSSFLLLVLVGISFNAKGQDLIFLSNDEVLHGKVTEIGIEEVSYLQAQYPEGPIYTIAKKSICKIKYGSGRVEYFGKCQKEQERIAKRAESEQMPSGQWSAGKQRVSLSGAYSVPFEDFREGNEFDGPQAIDGFSVGINYFNRFNFLPKWMALEAGLSYSSYTARFDTSFAGFDVGGGDFLNIQITPAQWSVIDLNLSVPILLVGKRNFEFSVAPLLGVSHAIEPSLNGSSSFFFVNTAFSNIQDQSTTLTYGGRIAANFAISENLSLGVFTVFQRGNLILDTDYTFTINGTQTSEQNQLNYSFSRMHIGVQTIYAF